MKICSYLQLWFLNIFTSFYICLRQRMQNKLNGKWNIAGPFTPEEVISFTPYSRTDKY